MKVARVQRHLVHLLWHHQSWMEATVAPAQLVSLYVFPAQLHDFHAAPNCINEHRARTTRQTANGTKILLFRNLFFCDPTDSEPPSGLRKWHEGVKLCVVPFCRQRQRVMVRVKITSSYPARSIRILPGSVRRVPGPVVRRIPNADELT